MDNEKLKPCPFCNGEAKLLFNGKNSFFINCSDCLCEMSGIESASKAIEAWNKRIQRDNTWLPFPINHPEFTLSKQAQKIYPWCWCKNGEDGESFLGMFTGSGNWTDNTGKKTDVTHYMVIEKP